MTIPYFVAINLVFRYFSICYGYLSSYDNFNIIPIQFDETLIHKDPPYESPPYTGSRKLPYALQVNTDYGYA